MSFNTQDCLINIPREKDPAQEAIFAMIEEQYEAEFGGIIPEPSEEEIDEAILAQANAQHLSDSEYDRKHPAF